MSFDADTLYRLLPQVYRTRDGSGALRALLRILSEQAQVLEEDLSRLYDNQFIETCEEWAVPYIGALVGARGLSAVPTAAARRRNEVANTLRLRRRKGTVAVLEELARDITDWDAAAVEFFRHLATTQYLNHLRPANLAFASIRDEVALEAIGTPFDTLARTAEVRRIEPGRGRYNIPNIGLFLWTLSAYPVTRSPAFKLDDFRYTFDALGRDIQLVTQPEVEEEITHLATEINVPLPIGRRRLDRELASYYGSGGDGAAKSILLRVNGADVVPALDSNGEPIGTVDDLVHVCDLSDVEDSNGNVIGWGHSSLGRIAIDPVLGRIAFPTDKPAPQKVEVTCYRGFSMEMGGGEYGRAEGFDADIGPLKQVAAGGSLQQALDDLQVSGGVVELTDNAYYIATPTVRVPAGKAIALRAADERRPILVLGGDLTVLGGDGAAFIVDGPLVSGGRIHAPLQDGSGNDNRLARLSLRHCTLVPGPTPAIGAAPAQAAQPRIVAEVPALRVEIEHSITGALRLHNECALSSKNSIVDALSPAAMAIAGLDGAAAAGSLQAVNATIVGRVHVSEIPLASNTLFRSEADSSTPAPLRAVQLAAGCVRFCYLPPGSSVPRPYRCQPATEADAGRVKPIFTSLTYGDPGYCQVSPRTAREIREGADDGAEMGAFHDLYAPQRLATLRARLSEFLRFGLEAGVIQEN